MEKRVLTVLRSGGEYGPQHVQAIQRQVAKWAPDARFICLSDVEINGVETWSLLHKWPGWWAKIELFEFGDFLYTDLDNVILGPLDFAWPNEFTADVGFSFFRCTEAHSEAYATFLENPTAHMAAWDPANRKDGRFGDAAFLRWRMGFDPAKWNPKFVTNVVDLSPPCPWRVTPPRIPGDLRVLLCGGKRRRPWLSLSQAVQRAYWCRQEK